MAKGKVVTSTSMTKWDEKLAALAASSKKLVNELGGGGNFISIRTGVLSTAEGNIPGNKMKVIVLHQIMENDWYESNFDPDTPVSPNCYAFGDTLAEMRPHENCSDPQGGPEGGCRGCPKNEFGTADRGKGKACQNRVRMALITADDLKNGAKAEIRYLKIPPTNLKTWRGYVNQVETTFQLPPLGVVTEIAVGPDPKNQVRVDYSLVGPVDKGSIGELLQLQERAAREIAFPYPEMTEEQAPMKKPAPGKKPKFVR